MMAYVEAHAQPGDGLLLANQLQRPIFEYYRAGGLDAYFFPRYDYPLEDPRTAARPGGHRRPASPPVAGALWQSGRVRSRRHADPLAGHPRQQGLL